MPDLRKRAFLLSSGSLLSNLIGAAMAVILSRLLTKDTYGTYQQAFLVYGILVGVMGLNLGASMLFFLPRSEPERQKTFVAQSVLMGIVAGTAIGAAMFVGSPWFGRWLGNEAVTPLLYIVAIFAVFNQVSQMTPAALVAVDRAGLVFCYTVICAVGRGIAIVLPFVLGCTLPLVFLFIVLWEGMAAGLGVLLLGKVVGIGIRTITWAGVLEEFRYMWPLLAATIVGSLSTQFDRAIVAFAFDPPTYAEYVNGAISIPIVWLLVSSISTSILPEMSRFAGEGRIGDMLDLWRRGATKAAAVVFPLVVFCLACPDYLMVLLYGDKYVASAIPFSIYCLSLVARVAMYGAVFQAIGHNLQQFSGAVVALVVGVLVSLTLVFVGHGTRLAFAGPAIGSTVGMTASIAYLIWRISHLVSCPVRQVLPLRKLGAVGLVALAAAVPAVALRWVDLALPVKLAAMACLFGLVYLVVCLKFHIIEKDDLRFARAMLMRLRGKAAAPESTDTK